MNIIRRIRTAFFCVMLSALLLVPFPASAEEGAAAAQVKVTTQTLNVRKGPGKDYAALGDVKAGEVLTVISLDEESGWYEIEFEGGRGYVSGKYVEPAGAAAQTSEQEQPEEPHGDLSDGTDSVRDVISSEKLLQIGIIGLVILAVVIATIITIRGIFSSDEEAEDEEESSLGEISDATDYALNIDPSLFEESRDGDTPERKEEQFVDLEETDEMSSDCGYDDSEPAGEGAAGGGDEGAAGGGDDTLTKEERLRVAMERLDELKQEIEELKKL